MALATRAVVGLSPSLPCCRLPSPPPLKRNAGSPFSGSKRGCATAGARLSWSCWTKRMPELARFASNFDQQPEESGGDGPSGDALFPPVLFMPYTEYLMALPLPICSEGNMIWLSWASLIASVRVEWHLSERMLRSFGLQQHRYSADGFTV